MIIGENMKLICEKESEVANTLNSKRGKAYIDIYKETDFKGLGILIDEELNIYKYGWGLNFNKETHNFANNNYLYISEKKINYEEIEKYIINELKILEKEYNDDSNEEERYSEILKLKSYVNEFANKDLYDKIKLKIANMIEEDL